MKAFAALLDGLLLAEAPEARIGSMARYLGETPDPERGWALALLAGGVDAACIRPAAVRALAAERIDAVLLQLSLDFVGDPVETAALLWPENGETPDPPTLAEAATALAACRPAGAPALLAGWLDRSDAETRLALLRLAAGRLRGAVPARLVRAALAHAFAVPLADIEHVWREQAPPYGALLAWLEGRGPRPPAVAGFRPLMPVAEGAPPPAMAEGWRAERDWPGRRVQAVAEAGRRRLYSSAGDDIAPLFPDILAAMEGLEGVIDGVLLVVRSLDGPPYPMAPAEALARRLRRRTPPPARLLAEAPAFLRAFDLLADGREDLRAAPLDARRARLEARLAGRARFDLSPRLGFADAAELEGLLETHGGLVLKPAAAPYRPEGPPWLRLRGAPRRLPLLLLSERREPAGAPEYSLGVWRGEKPVAVGAAPCRLAGEERKRLDRWVRAHTLARYGPVRACAPLLALEVAFRAVRPAPRRISGLVLVEPEIRRILWDLPAAEAARLETLAALVRSE